MMLLMHASLKAQNPHDSILVTTPGVKLPLVYLYSAVIQFHLTRGNISVASQYFLYLHIATCVFLDLFTDGFVAFFSLLNQCLRRSYLNEESFILA